METELFGAIKANYDQASANMWYWHKRQYFLVKLITFIWVVPASIILKIIGLLFGLGVILDYISVWLQSKRNKVVTSINNAANRLYFSKSAYIFTPIITLLLAPIALLLGIIPKWSATLVTSVHADLNPSTGIEHGYFTKLGKSYLKLTAELFKNINQHGFFFALIALVITIVVAPITLIIAMLFFVLIILDLIGWLVGLIRKFVISSSGAMARNSGNGVISVVIMPVFLVLFVPVYIVLLLIPKIATYDEV